MNEFQAAMIEAARMPADAWADLASPRITALQIAMAERIRDAQRHLPDPDDALPDTDDDDDPEPPYPAPLVSLACAAPAEVELARQPILPLLIMLYANGLRDWQVSSTANMLVVASNLETGAIRVVRPMDSDKRMRDRGLSSDAPLPNAFNAGMTSSEIEPIDLLKFGFDRMSADLALSAIDYDVCSNVVSVRVIGQEHPPRVVPLADASWFVQPQPYDGPPDRASCSLRLLADTVPPVGRFVVRGDVRVAAPRYAPQSRADDGPLLPVSLLFVQKDRRAVEQANLLIPVQLSAGMVEGGFEFDLWDTGMVPFGRTQIYLVAGSELAGPYPVMREG